MLIYYNIYLTLNVWCAHIAFILTVPELTVEVHVNPALHGHFAKNFPPYVSPSSCAVGSLHGAPNQNEDYINSNVKQTKLYIEE